MNDDQTVGLSDEELSAHGATALPDKEVVSILDLNADINLAIDAAAPIDLAVAANANVAAPIDAAVGANVLSVDSSAQALSDQGVLIHQGLDADATAHSTQDSALDQGADTAATDPTAATAAPTGSVDSLADPSTGGVDTGAVGGAIDGATGAVDGATGAVDGATGAVDGATGAVDGATGAVDGATGAVGGAVGGATAGNMLDGDLLKVDVNVDANADVAAPINGAVAANANVAAPIDAAVGANVGSEGSDAIAVSQQDAIINQDISGSADATSDQQSDITQ
jgi:hypothetical protein